MTNIILVVDDEPTNLSLATDVLDSGGFTVLVSQSAENALSILGEIDVDLVLLDAMMPGTNGFQMCQIMKKTPEYRDIPVIFMTGLSGQKDIVQAFDAGSVDYIIKPIQPAELLARVKTHLKNAQNTKYVFRAIDFSGHHFLASDETGNLLWFTPQIPTMLDHTLTKGIPCLPKDAMQWLLSCIQEPSLADVRYRQPGRNDDFDVELSFMGQPDPGEYLIRLSIAKKGQEIACLQKRLGLTLREAEVLFWIAKGKTNRDIAEILSISHRTVNKHLEQSYVKIGVENRAAATARVLQALLT